MLKNILLFVMGIALFTSCKKECDSSTRKVGFYYQDSQSKNEETTKYKLYVDNVYMGDLNVLSSAPACGDTLLLYCTLDSTRHYVEVRNERGECLNSQYLQITNNETRSGTGKNCQKIVGNGRNGATCASNAGDDCTTFGFFN